MEEMAPYIKNKTEVSEMFSEANLFQSYLDVEAALAKALSLIHISEPTRPY